MLGCIYCFQNPGFDFSHAKLSKTYDSLPGWSVNALKKKKNEDKETCMDS